MRRNIEGVGVNETKRVRLVYHIEERTTETRGAAEIDRQVRTFYEQQGYGDMPTEPTKGVKGYNKLVVSAPLITHTSSGEVLVHAFPTRYMFRQAHEDAWKASQADLQTRTAMSPRLLHTSLMIIGEYKGQKGIFGQVKAPDVLGGGQFHAGFVAGGVEPGHIGPSLSLVPYADPTEVSFRKALTKRLLVEMGIDIQDIDHSKVAYEIHEPDGGHVNYAHVLLGVQDGTDLLHRFENYHKGLGPDDKPQVQGIAFFPFDERSIGNGLALENMISAVPGEDGTLVLRANSLRDGAGIRPYTWEMAEYLGDTGKIGRLLDLVEGEEVQYESRSL